MATLEINGQRVQVDDSFLSLPPEQQEATVDEIAQSLSSSQGPRLSPAQTRYQVALNDTRRTQFPGMSDQQWREYSERAFGPSLNNQSEQIATFGFGDEIGAGMGALGSQLRQLTGGGGPGFGQAYEDYKELEEARRDLSREQNGLLGTGVEFATGMGMAAPATGAALTAGGPAMSTLETAARGAGAGAATGAIFGAGSADGDLQDRAVEALQTGGLGAGLGFAAPFAGQLIGNTVGRLFKRNRPSLPNNVSGTVRAASAPIREQADELFKAIDESSVRLTPESFRSLFDGFVQSAGQNRFKPGFDTQTAKFLSEVSKVADLNQPVHLADLHILRQQAQALLRSSEGRDTHFLPIFIDKIDDMVRRLRPNQIVGGSPQTGNDLLRAMSLWAQSKRTTAIEDAIYNANLARGGFESGLRTEFTKLLRMGNGTSELQRSGFSLPEQEAIEKFVQGGPMSEFLHRLSGMRGVMGGVMGGVGGGPVGAVGIPAAGMGARIALTQGAKGTARNVLGAVSGMSANPPVIPQVPYLPSLLAPGALPSLQERLPN